MEEQLRLFGYSREEFYEVYSVPEHKGFSPGHPCYYKYGGLILEVDNIPPAYIPEEFGKREKPEIIRARLNQDIERYNDLVTRKYDALSKYDIEIAHGGDKEMALFTALSLKYNHISSGKGALL